MELIELEESTGCKTILKLSKIENGDAIKQLIYIGAIPIKETEEDVCFKFDGDSNETLQMLGIAVG